ncbi:Metal-sulfur cluster biosynthetic enzyme [Halopelagius inordinatus]|uniref:Metal-sulfur cluster biosynthetic enzyme n=1 Tax=Halopelagius inordinatus TaxID=553467 RepID=A0A1I2WRZ0_9EURY|nr:iron-sulfur cluster assembly protein [Halopelagius inordinatus]SFH04120.1 Metal-sulfur cluster biosynthetic enzyme [Halopelagius inordinatus]
MSVEPTDDSEGPAGRSREHPPDRTAVLSVLDRVMDPELDRSIVELGYVDEVRIESDEDGARVAVEFTLPTAWCSPAFAWMMATDARDGVESMRGVDDCTVRLREHMHQTEVNEGVNGGRSFADAFPDAEGGVADVRATLDSKARVARQYDAVETLLDAGLGHEQVAELTRDDFEPLPTEGRMAVYVRDRSVGLDVPSEPVVRYLRKADEVGLYDDGDETASRGGEDRLFRTPEGDPIPPARAELVHRRARLAKVNMSGQGGVCDALHEARREELADDD